MGKRNILRPVYKSLGSPAEAEARKRSLVSATPSSGEETSRVAATQRRQTPCFTIQS
jgi:hypothetical protein